MIFFTNRVFYLFRLFPAIGSKLPTNEKGSTALHWAAKNGKFEIYQLISDDLNAEYKNPKDADGITPLHLAAEEGNYEVCNLIMNSMNNKEDNNQKDT